MFAAVITATDCDDGLVVYPAVWTCTIAYRRQCSDDIGSRLSQTANVSRSQYNSLLTVVAFRINQAVVVTVGPAVTPMGVATSWTAVIVSAAAKSVDGAAPLCRAVKAELASSTYGASVVMVSIGTVELSVVDCAIVDWPLISPEAESVLLVLVAQVCIAVRASATAPACKRLA